MYIIYNWYINLLWLFIGFLSFFISVIIQCREKPIKNFQSTDKLPRWVAYIFWNIHDPYSFFFRIGGIVLAILSIPVGFVSSQMELDIAMWISIICYFSIPSYFIRRWR